MSSMFGVRNTDSVDQLSIPKKIIIIIAVFIFYVSVFYIFPTPSADWRNSFYPASQNLLYPYTVKTFMNLPWTVLFLYPLHFFSETVSQAINTSLNLVVFGLLVIHKKGNLLSVFLTLTFFPFLKVLINGSIEWIPAIGFFFQNGFGIFLLLTKPQSGSLAIIDWFFRSKDKVLLLIFPIIGVIGSFILWKDWPISLLANIRYVQNLQFGLSDWNISLFPWLIPVGLGLVFYIIKQKPANAELLGVIATFCLVPYFALQSLTILFALLSASHPRSSIAVWFLLWMYAFIHHWSIFIQAWSL